MTDWRDRVRNPSCELCPLHEKAEFVCLMGSGPKRSKIVVVGEAPGAREDEKHEAFVGPAGRLLNSSLAQVGIERDTVYVTNVAKCRPPNNRTPELKEIKTCIQNYLVQELEHIKPEFVLLLGNSALRGVVGKSGIMKQSGTVFEAEVADDHWAKIMPIIHPAAVLRNPKWADTFGADMVRFGNLVKGINTSPQTSIKLITKKKHLLWLRRKLMQATEISWDIETDTERVEGFIRGPGQDWHGDESYITTIAFSTEEGEAATVPIHHPDAPWDSGDKVLNYLRPALLQEGVKYIAHNGKYDARWMHSKGIPVPQTFDTMLAAHMLDENRLKGLKPLSRVYLAADAYDVGEDVKQSMNAPLRKLAIYNAKDADYTLRLYHLFRDELKQDERVARVFIKLMMPASNALVEIERHGVYVDMERWNERYITACENRDKLYAYITRFVPDHLRPLNLNSPQQVARWLFEHLELPIIQTTDKGHPSTAEAVLLRLEDQHVATKAMIKYRKWAKYVNTYLTPWRYEWMDAHFRIHSSYKLFGTVTGRLSGEGGIQQVPRDPFMRSIIGAPPGWKFVEADYSQVELRVAAWLANDRVMLRSFLEGTDIHMTTAMKVTGKIRPSEVTSEERKKAKSQNFALIYGVGAKKLVSYSFDNYGIKITLDEAEEARRIFFDTYQGFKPWHDRQRRLARRYHQVSSPIGRVRHLPDILSSDDGVKGESERQAINSPVQSFASDLMLISLVELHNLLEPTEARIVGTVHDSILFEVREDKVDYWAPVIKDTMEDMTIVKRKFGTDITIPIVAELEVGDHWGEGEPWSNS